MIQSVDRAIDILNEISRREDWVGVREIARALNLKVPTTQQMLKTLLAKGLLEFDQERRQYRLGLGLWVLAGKVNPLDGLARFIAPHVENLFRRFGETVVVLALVNDNVRVVIWRQSKHSLAVIVPDEKGIIAELHHLAGGRVVLAFSGRSFREAYLKKLRFPEAGKNLFRSAEEFTAELERIRTRGYAVTKDIMGSGIGALAVPVFYGNGEFAMAMASSMPLNRFKTEKKDQILKNLRDISATLRL
ncbi:MAG: IclR family transcriptional regulator [Verrucomicrobia bacterium]|nr:IclR family transcriptional regulator [Verrucomicrobiota bacterium]MBU1734296.1 IclR family transcriptional regulator [Verrucomicrobiota bacterium]MBU1857017.1 IclR family transcriptional regulator [Verrucomicrobiota bacterium]